MNVLSIDIVIPTFRLDEKTLLAITDLPKPENCNIYIYIIADNPAVRIPGSIQSLSESGEIKLIVNSKNMGPAATRNAGIEAGNSKWIFFLDDDILPKQDLLFAYADAIQKNTNAIGFAGVTYFPVAFNAVTKALEIHGAVDSFTYALGNETIRWAPTANLVLNREKLGKERFDETLQTAEDIDLLTRNSLALHEKYISVPNAVVHHAWWNNGGIQTKRMLSYGDGASQMAQKEYITRYSFIDFTNTSETLLLLLLALPFAFFFGYGQLTVMIMLVVVVAEYITNWLRAIIKGKNWSPFVAFNLLWIKNCWELGFLYTSFRKGYINNFARRIEMGFNKPNPSPFRLNKWKMIKMLLISIGCCLILWCKS